VQNSSLVRAVVAAAACFGAASAWRILGERQEVVSRRGFVRTLLDAGQLRMAQFQAARLEADFATDETGRLHATTRTLLEANTLLRERRAKEARARLAPIAAAGDAPAVAHLLLGRALIAAGDRAAGEAELAKAREVAPDAPLFKTAARGDVPGDG
jgi:hypothetical protein